MPTATRKTTSRIYGLPKIRRDNMPLRSIISCISSTTYNVAKSLATILVPLVGNKNTDFKSKLRTSYWTWTRLSSPLMPPVSSLVYLQQKQWKWSERDHNNATQICSLLDCCQATTNVQYHEGFFRQKQVEPWVPLYSPWSQPIQEGSKQSISALQRHPHPPSHLVEVHKPYRG